jgi:cell wall-associated NlpC family hydrolase
MRNILSAILIALCAAAPAQADETTAAQLPDSFVSRAVVSRAVDNVEGTLDRALDFIGVRYKRGGSSPETGFDCSGFVKYLYDETLGLVLPHNAKAIAQQGERVEKAELRPGDLVFFNTMRRAFSHVGIYLGDNRFIHAPRAGKRVRIEDMSDRYWSRRFNGARRIQP